MQNIHQSFQEDEDQHSFPPQFATMQHPTQASAGRQPTQMHGDNFNPKSHPIPQSNPQTHHQAKRQANHQTRRQANRQTNTEPNFQAYENPEQNAEQIHSQPSQTSGQQPAVNTNARLLENILNSIQNFSMEMLVGVVSRNIEQQQADREEQRAERKMLKRQLEYSIFLVELTQTSVRAGMLQTEKGIVNARAGVFVNNNAGISSSAHNSPSPNVTGMESVNGPDTNGFNPSNMNNQGSFNGGAPFMGHMNNSFVDPDAI